MKFSFNSALLLAIIIFSKVLCARYEIVVDKVDRIHPMILKAEAFELSSPAGSYQTLFESTDDIGHRCLIYKVPLGVDTNNGKLFFLRGDNKCSIGTKGAKEEIIFENTDHLKVFDIDWNKKFSFKIKAKNKDQVLEFFLPFPSKEKGFWKGIRPFSDNQDSTIIKLKDGELCFQGCSDNANRCGECPRGQWTAFISMKCSNQLSGMCGSYQCGQRGQKACVRMTVYRKDISCDEMKKYVFCSYGREVECQSNGDLTCR